MVRCDDFYRKWQKAGNFCEKHPKTAERIDIFLNEIIVELETEVAKSEILSGYSRPIGPVLTEGASRPLISEHDPNVRQKAYKQIVKAVEDKVIDCKRPQVTGREVESIIKEVKEKPSHKSQFNKTNDNIEWAPYSWNPVTGCKNDCPYCYARDIAVRFMPSFEPTFHPERLNAPENTPVPASDKPGANNVFVCSMADLFGDWVPEEWIAAVLDQVEKHPEWNFLFLTKNPKRLSRYTWPKNAWIGATVDCQARAKATEEAFRQIDAPVRFVSCEPLLEPVIFDDLSCFDWLIIGGRSRNTKMPEFQPEWAWVENLVDQAREAGLNVYFKPNLTVRPKEYPLS
jgi:protein gp37